MKLLFCERCGDIIAPHRIERKPRYCTCATHAVWWEDSKKGILRVYDMCGRDGWPNRAEAWVIGITNSFLGYPGNLNKVIIQDIIESHDEHYLFKRQWSCIIRIRPGETGDTRWAPLPVKENE